MINNQIKPAYLRTIIAIIFVIFFMSSFPAFASLDNNSIPTPISPADKTVTTVENYSPLGIPTFVWNAVPGATEYKLQISNDIEFAKISLEIISSYTSYTPTNMDETLFADGLWYWRIRVEKPENSDYSVAMRFSKKWASVTNFPILIAPESEATLAFFTSPTFTWSHVTGATQYRFQIASNRDSFDTPLLDQLTYKNSYQPANKLANGQYYWRVIPVDSASHLGTASETRGFSMHYGSQSMEQVPSPISPQDDVSVIFTPSFHWKAIPGAEKYQIEILLDDGLCLNGSGVVVDTQLSVYTPTSTLANGDYCWHVRVISGNSIGDWSETFHFQKRWNIQPIPLLPINYYKYGLYPIFQWTPVPGASYYKMEISIDEEWSKLFDETLTSNTTYSTRKIFGSNPLLNPYSWRVTPYDWDSHPGKTGEIFTFNHFYTSTAPSLVFPFYYYTPNDPDVYGDIRLYPNENHTAQYPVFIWQRTNNPWPVGGTFARAYRIQVSTLPYFSTIVWTVDTENTHAAPTENNPFPTIDPDQNYYWRVCPLDDIGGQCKTVVNKEDEWWSQVWRARFNPEKGLPPTIGDSPVLIRPGNGDEWVETMPLLEWQALEGAEYYQVQISHEPTFTIGEELFVDVNVPFPVYSALKSQAQRYLNRLEYGTFYWRARANLDGTLSEWSEIRRFQIASQSEWRYDRVIGEQENRLQIGADPSGDTEKSYDLTRLYASSSKDNWYFGFNINLTPDVQMVYGIYLDLDHVDGSGANAPPPDWDYPIQTIAAHQPEIAIFIDQKDGSVSKDDTWIYEYTDNEWQEPHRLSDIGGSDLFYDDTYIEIQLPITSIHVPNYSGSISMMLFTVDPSSVDILVDTVPKDPEVPGSNIVSRFTSVTEHMNVWFPPNSNNTLSPDPSVRPFIWDYPTGGDPTGLVEDPPSPWAGSRLTICDNPDCSSIVETLEHETYSRYYASTNQTTYNDISGDATYFWQIQPRYLYNDMEFYGAYSGVYSITRKGFVPINLKTSPGFTTPTFFWDLVEGAGAYDIQVSISPNFNTTDLVINLNAVAQNSYTPLSDLEPGEYWWRVRTRRFGNLTSQWSIPSSFEIILPTPTGLFPDDPLKLQVFNYLPTLCWEHTVVYDGEIPYFSAWKYQVVISKDQYFTTLVDSVITEQNCWTPTQLLEDGTYYWHVAMIDSNNNVSGYSDNAIFTKQYPTTTIVNPVGTIDGALSFVWTPVNTAALYYLQVSQSMTFFPLDENVQTINVQYTPIRPYDTNKQYYWRVAMVDKADIAGSYTNAKFILGNLILRLPIVIKQ